MGTGWRGRIVDERGEALPHLVVAVEDALDRPRARLALGSTDAQGHFVVEPPTEDAWDAPSGLALAVYDPLGLRPLHRTRADRREAGDLVVPRAVASGWTTTRADGAPVRLSHGNDVAVALDEDAFAMLTRAIDGARRALSLSQLWFEPDFVASPHGAPREPLLDHVIRAARRGVRVRLLLNENKVINDSCARVARALADAGDDGISLRRFPISPNVMHVKILLVDDEEGFVIGPPFQPRYWDTGRHRPDDPRREGHTPLHDAVIRARGPLVAHLHEMFAALWNLRGEQAHGGEDALPPIAPPPPCGDVTAQLVQTVPPALLPDAQRGETTLLSAYLRAIAAARDYVYVETQYFTSPTVAEALKRALLRRPELQVILVMNETTDVPTYVAWQKRRLAEMNYPRLDRLGVFVLQSPAPVYVHAKIALADDAWATIGTANLDSISLETADEFGAPVDPNVDANVVLLDDVEGAAPSGIVARLRRRLFAEHLGDRVVWSTSVRPEGGWLALWRAAAEENARLIADGKRPRGFAVPYLPRELARGVDA